MKKTILIIDDSEHERRIFSRFLHFVGGRALEAPNGKAGLWLAREKLPSLILLDLSMPVMDGWETIRRLREDPATRGIPAIALTAQRLEWRRLAEAGFSSYLEKPIVPYRVLEEVEHHVGRLSFQTAPAREGEALPRGVLARPRPAFALTG